MAGKHVGAWRNSSDPLPGFQWNERTTKAYAEGRYNIAPNGHVSGSDAYRAYVAGAALSADLTQAFESGAGAGGADPFAPIAYGYDFSGSANYAQAQVDVDSDIPLAFAIKFRRDTAGAAQTLFMIVPNQFRVRVSGVNVMEVQAGGSTLFSYADLPTIETGKEYSFGIDVNNDGTSLAILRNLTDRIEATSTAFSPGLSTGAAGATYIGAASDSAGFFPGIIADVRYAEDQFAPIENEWRFDDGSGTTATDYAGGNTADITGSGAWYTA